MAVFRRKKNPPFSGPSFLLSWLRGEDLNLRPLGYEPNELPDCSPPRHCAKYTRHTRECQAVPPENQSLPSAMAGILVPDRVKGAGKVTGRASPESISEPGNRGGLLS